MCFSELLLEIVSIRSTHPLLNDDHDDATLPHIHSPIHSSHALIHIRTTFIRELTRSLLKNAINT